MSDNDRSVSEILDSAQEQVEFAKNSLEKYKDDIENRRKHLMNIAMFGQNSLYTLKQLKKKAEGADEWYKDSVNEMKSDPLMDYFHNLRNDVVHEGKLQTGASAVIGKDKPVNVMEVAREMEDPPERLKPYVTGTFFGDNLGGNGYNIEFPDGTEEKYYVDLPTDQIETWVSLPDPPKRHLGNSIKDDSAENLSRVYISYLDDLIQEARRKFEQ